MASEEWRAGGAAARGWEATRLQCRLGQESEPPEGGTPARNPTSIRRMISVGGCSRRGTGFHSCRRPPLGPRIALKGQRHISTGHRPVRELIALAEIKTDLTPEGTENTEGEGTTNQTNLTNKEKRIGLVGPMSNYAPPPQWVENVPYKGLEEMGGDAQAVGRAATDGDGSG